MDARCDRRRGGADFAFPLVMIALNPLDQAARLRRRPRLRPRLSVERLTHGEAADPRPGLRRNRFSTNAEARRRAEAGEGGPFWITAARADGRPGPSRARSGTQAKGNLAATLAHRRPSKSASEAALSSRSSPPSPSATSPAPMRPRA